MLSGSFIKINVEWIVCTNSGKVFHFSEGIFEVPSSLGLVKEYNIKISPAEGNLKLGELL